MPTVHLLIKGKVQGVFYRATAKDVASQLGLTGWIKNTEEGQVEAVVSASQEKLNEFTDWCWRGPSRARVSEVVISKVEEQLFKNFSIQH